MLWFIEKIKIGIVLKMDISIQSADNKTKINRIVTIVISIVVMTAMIYSIALELSEMWQVPKDKLYFQGVMLSLVLVYIIRQIPFKKYEVWSALILGILLLFAWFKYKGISTETYGEIYYWVILYKWIIWVLFIPLLVDLIRPFKVNRLLPDNWIKTIIYAIFILATVTTDVKFVIPCLCPAYAFMTTKLTRKRWLDFFDCLAFSVWITFVYIFTKSLLFYSDRLETGRLMGLFISVENMGTFCGLGFVSALYFVIRLMYSRNRKWYMFVAPIIMVAYPAYGIILTASRTTQVGTIIVLLCAFIFMHGKEKKSETFKRFLISLLCLGIMIMALLGLSKYYNYKVDNGAKFDERKGYVVHHIARLTGNTYDSGYFEKGSLLNALDGFLSGRLRCWAEAVKQIEYKGHPYEIREPLGFTSPHNFFIQKMIEMGWIKGILFHIYLIVAVILGLRGCVKRNEKMLLPTVWILYSIPVLGSTILSWNSILPFGMLLFSSIITCGDIIEE